MKFIKKNLVLLFHVPTSLEWFENTIKIISKFYRFVSISDIRDYYDGKSDLTGCCHITFDDGHKAVYNNAFPVLKSYNIPATLFISPSVLINKNNYWFQEISQYKKEETIRIISKLKSINPAILGNMDEKEIMKECTLNEIQTIINKLNVLKNSEQYNCQNIKIDELIELKKSNIFTIGSHSYNHPILANESDPVSEYEIRESKIELEKILGDEVKYFAYPNGIPELDYSEREINYCANSKYELAFTCEISDFSRNNSNFEIPRLEISSGSQLLVAAKILIYDLIKKRLMNQKMINDRKLIRSITKNSIKL